MMDGMRPAVTNTPLIAPQRAPTATPASAMIPSTATEITMDSKLEPLRNVSLLREKPTTSTARNTRAGASGRTMNLRKTSPREVPRCSPGARASVIAHLLSGVIGSGAIPSSGGRGHHVLLRGLFSLELTCNAALSHDHDPVGHREDFFQLR